MAGPAIGVMGREAVPGQVKTRLAREIGTEAAAMAYRDLLALTLDVVSRVPVSSVLFLPPGDRPPDDLAPGLMVARQRGPDLGARLAEAFDELFARGYDRVVLVGSDCPYVTPDLLLRGLDALRDADTVFGPAEDGGYWLVGQRPPARDLFRDIPWSTDAVWDVTRRRLAQRRWSVALLPVLEDVDDAPALRRWRSTRTP